MRGSGCRVCDSHDPRFCSLAVRAGVYIHTCMYVCMYVRTYVCMYVYIYIHIYMYIYVYVYTYMYICIHIYKNEYTIHVLHVSYVYNVGGSNEVLLHRRLGIR